MAHEADGPLATQLLGHRAQVGERLAAPGGEGLRELPDVEAHDHVLSPRAGAPDGRPALVLVKQPAE